MNNQILDIRPPIDIPNPWMWLWIVLGVVAILALIIWLGYQFLKRPGSFNPEEPLKIVSAWEKAYARLENLRIKNLIERGDLKPFYSELSDIIRRYLEERFSIRAPEMTTEEFLYSLRDSTVLNDLQKQTLEGFMFTSDMVKFAKHQPTANEAQKSFDLAKQLVDSSVGPKGTSQSQS